MSIQLQEFPLHYRLHWGPDIIETTIIKPQMAGFTEPPCAIQFFNFIFHGRVWSPGTVPGSKVFLYPIPIGYLPPLMDTLWEKAQDDADLWLGHTPSDYNGFYAIRLGYPGAAILSGDCLTADSLIALDQQVLVFREQRVLN